MSSIMYVPSGFSLWRLLFRKVMLAWWLCCASSIIMSKVWFCRLGLFHISWMLVGLFWST